MTFASSFRTLASESIYIINLKQKWKRFVKEIHIFAKMMHFASISHSKNIVSERSGKLEEISANIAQTNAWSTFKLNGFFYLKQEIHFSRFP